MTEQHVYFKWVALKEDVPQYAPAFREPLCSGSARASKGRPVKTWFSVLGDEMPTASSSCEG